MIPMSHISFLLSSKLYLSVTSLFSSIIPGILYPRSIGRYIELSNPASLTTFLIKIDLLVRDRYFLGEVEDEGCQVCEDIKELYRAV